MKRYIIPFFLLVLLTSCRPDLSGYNRDDTDLELLFSSAASGSPEMLYDLGRNGGNGAWFALAAAAEDAGYAGVSRELRIRSAEEDGAPFGPRSLAELLLSDPEAIKRPLTRIRQAEKRYGSTDSLRFARIAVLHSLGNDRLLISEMENFTGNPREAAVLAAGLRQGGDDPVLMARTMRFILHCTDPGALDILSGLLPEDMDDAYQRLLQARVSFSRGLFPQALEDYRYWLTEEVQSLDECSLEAPPPVFNEMNMAARESGLVLPWAGILASSALNLSGTDRFAAAFGAGDLFKRIGDRPAALKAFTLAVDAVPAGLERDRAMWQSLALRLRDNSLSSGEEASAFSAVFAIWDRPERFTDHLDEFLHRRVYRGEWELLESLFTDWGSQWPDLIRSQAAWILAFAVREDRLTGSVREYLEISAESSPLSWSGLRAAGLLDRSLEIAVSESLGGDAEEELSENDLTALLLLDWGMINNVTDAILANPDDYSNHAIRSTATALAEIEPRTSIRVAGLLYGKPGYVPNREDLFLRFPLPYADLAGTTAQENNLPREIFFGLIRTESAWDRNAVSSSGAQGLAQFMPSTWEEWVGRMKLPGSPDPFDPEINLLLAASYLNWLHEREWTFGWIDVLASYNAGGGWVRTWRRDSPGLGDDLFGASLPVEEPRSYISKVLSAATLYGYLYAGERPRVLHEQWGLEMFEVN